ncbi:chromosomal replication initiator protein DnaA [Bifidobacterium choloepi]|uniref:Chromosomal replication initiator protein DnaA n=1 Tax=Bifidobacterium choloepi TaxID=2614131 RepID=A0A6I5NI21_9BIFI|nr:chromosomal replication initiator protein DnaA [Bifidobacterium choloepi]
MGGETLDPVARAQSIWSDTLAILGGRVTDRQKAWLMGVVPESVNGPSIMLCVRDNETLQTLVGQLYMVMLQALQIANAGQPLYPSFKIDPSAPAVEEPNGNDAAAAPASTSTQTPAAGSSNGFVPLPTDAYPAATEQASPSTGTIPAVNATTSPAPAITEEAIEAAQQLLQQAEQQGIRPITQSMPIVQAAQAAAAATAPSFAPAVTPQTVRRPQTTHAGQSMTGTPGVSQPTAASQQATGRQATQATAQVHEDGQHAVTASQGELPIPSTIPERHVVAAESSTPMRDPISHLNKAATFDTFVPGSSNRFARTVALAVAEGSGRDYNPLCIYGGSGLGKTHLLNAIGNYALVKDPSLRVRYVTSEEFTNEYIDAIRSETENSRTISDFNKRYRDEVDMLLIDDIQFLSGKDSTLEQFFHTFNALKESDKRIVLSSDVPPKNLKGFEARLISRFESGLTVDVQPPDLETRTAILQMMAQTNHYSIPKDVIDLIARRFTENIRELEGALTRITAMASITNQPVSYALAEQTLRDFFVADVELKPTDIIGQVAQYFHLSFDDLVGRSRTKNVALARQVAMYLTREMTSMSLVDIGQVFGGLDHTTVMYGCKKISSKMSEKKEIYNYVMELTVRLKHS